MRDPHYELLLLLDRLEELLEDMDELGITSRDELVERIRELEQQVDDETAEESGDGPV